MDVKVIFLYKKAWWFGVIKKYSRIPLKIEMANFLNNSIFWFKYNSIWYTRKKNAFERENGSSLNLVLRKRCGLDKCTRALFRIVSRYFQNDMYRNG